METRLGAGSDGGPRRFTAVVPHTPNLRHVVQKYRIL